MSIDLYKSSKGFLIPLIFSFSLATIIGCGGENNNEDISEDIEEAQLTNPPLPIPIDPAALTITAPDDNNEVVIKGYEVVENPEDIGAIIIKVSRTGEVINTTVDSTGSFETTIPNCIVGDLLEIRVQDSKGNNSESAFIEVPPVGIIGIDPKAGPIGTLVFIRGNNYSVVLSENRVFFNSIEAEVLDVKAGDGGYSRILTHVPKGATSGPLWIEKIEGAKILKSNEVKFMVTDEPISEETLPIYPCSKGKVEVGDIEITKDCDINRGEISKIEESGDDEKKTKNNKNTDLKPIKDIPSEDISAK